MTKSEELKLKLFDLVRNGKSKEGQTIQVDCFAVPEENLKEFTEMYLELLQVEKLEKKEKEQQQEQQNEMDSQISKEPPKVDVSDIINAAKGIVENDPAAEINTNYISSIDGMKNMEYRKKVAAQPVTSNQTQVETDTPPVIEDEKRIDVTFAPDGTYRWSKNSAASNEKEEVTNNQTAVTSQPPSFEISQSPAIPEHVESRGQATNSPQAAIPQNVESKEIDSTSGVVLPSADSFLPSGKKQWEYYHLTEQEKKLANVNPLSNDISEKSILPESVNKEMVTPVDTTNILPTSINKENVKTPDPLDILPNSINKENVNASDPFDILPNSINKEIVNASDPLDILPSSVNKETVEDTFPGIDMEAYDEAKKAKDATEKSNVDKEIMELLKDITPQRHIVRSIHKAADNLVNQAKNVVKSIYNKAQNLITKIKDISQQIREKQEAKERKIATSNTHIANSLEQVDFQDINEVLKIQARRGYPEGEKVSEEELQKDALKLLKKAKFARPGEEPAEAYQRLKKTPLNETFYLGVNDMPKEYQDELYIEPEMAPHTEKTKVVDGKLVIPQANNRVMMNIDDRIYQAALILKKEREASQQINAEQQTQAKGK